MVLYLILMVAIFVVAGVLFVYFSSKKQAITTDQILTARGSSPWWQVTLSSIAVLMGAWALFSPQETAMIAGVPGCFAFALGSVLGIFVFGFVGRRIRKYLPNGSSGTEFMRLRYGKLSYYLMTIISLIGMGIMLTSELTGISSAFNALWGIPRWIVIVVVLIGVLIYTTCGGIKASLFVDSIQTAVIIPTFIVLFFYMISHVGGVSAVVSGVQERAPQLLDWGYGYGWQHGGGFALGLFTAIFVDQSYWQRAYAVKDEKNMIKTFTCVGIILLPMLLLAASFGLIAAGTIDVQNQSIVMFELLNAMAPKWLQVIVLFMALALIMSTASGSINGITSILAVETKNLMAAKSHNGTVNGKKGALDRARHCNVHRSGDLHRCAQGHQRPVSVYDQQYAGYGLRFPAVLWHEKPEVEGLGRHRSIYLRRDRGIVLAPGSDVVEGQHTLLYAGSIAGSGSRICDPRRIRKTCGI